MTQDAHKTPSQNHPISWRFSSSHSTIAEVESRACKPALPRRSDVADCNGKEKDYESGFHYYGARYYWGELLTGWLSVDPMVDKYPSMSPYAYCAWNPVKLVDPDGREFDPASQEIVNAFKETTMNLIKSTDCTPEKQEEYNAALKEIAQLEKPGQMYHIQNVGDLYSREKGGIQYQLEDNSICIEYDGRDGSLAHELKHAYQFEIGEISFSKDGKNFGVLYDITDETAALKRGGAYDKKQYETLKGVEYLYRFKVKGNSEIDWYYPFLDKAPNKHCIVGHRSTSRTVKNAQSLNLDLSNDYYKMP